MGYIVHARAAGAAQPRARGLEGRAQRLVDVLGGVVDVAVGAAAQLVLEGVEVGGGWDEVLLDLLRDGGRRADGVLRSEVVSWSGCERMGRGGLASLS